MDILGDREMMVGGNQAFNADCGNGSLWGCLTESPCKRCSKFKSYHGWEAGMCAETCEKISGAKTPISSMKIITQDKPKNTKPKTYHSCSFDGCDKKQKNKKFPYCPRHTQVVANRRLQWREVHGVDSIAPIEWLHRPVNNIMKRKFTKCTMPWCENLTRTDYCKTCMSIINKRKKSYRKRHNNQDPPIEILHREKSKGFRVCIEYI